MCELARPRVNAAMEPLPKERSDATDASVHARVRHSRNGAAPEGAERRISSLSPQRCLSRCRNGAAPEGAERPQHTRCSPDYRSCRNGAAPEGAERHTAGGASFWTNLGPQWSRSRRSGATACDLAAGAGAHLAAMEPLPKERSDEAASHAAACQHGRRNGAAPEGAERRRQQDPPPVRHGPAAMEPLPKERSDFAGHAANANLLLPQWSRSRRSGATAGLSSSASGGIMPQWSRSRRSGATTVKASIRTARSISPQWSRSRRSGATDRVPGRLAVGAGAAMEPLPKERSDLPAAERERGARGIQRLAAMEPLPKERSDAFLDTRAGLPLLRPQWSRSRRSGATRRRRWSGSAPCSSRNGAAPEGAERRCDGVIACHAATAPQWSRSRRSGATFERNGKCPTCARPQWSRSRRSGATQVRRMPRYPCDRRNGAAPEGAERRSCT